MTSEDPFARLRPPEVSVRRTPGSLSETGVDFRVDVSPHADERTMDYLRAAVVAWGIYGATGGYDPETFNMPFFLESTPDVVFGGEQATPDTVLQWEISTELFGDASIAGLAEWIRRALIAASDYASPEAIRSVLWVGV